METARLQKGLVLILDDKELIEEGVGFGVPVVKYKDKTYFSSSAKVSIKRSSAGYVLTKAYVLDTVSQKKLWRAPINDDVYTPLRKTFEKLYLKHRKLSPLFNKLMELRELAKIKTNFIKKPSRGTVTVTYSFQPTAVHVNVDLSELTLNECQEVLVLNEQGSSVFQRYVDASGLTLLGSKIGAWDAVKANQASVQSTMGQLAFSLQNTRDAVLFRGWEHTRKRFSWAGLSYSLLPNNGTFEYSIGLKFEPK